MNSKTIMIGIPSKGRPEYITKKTLKYLEGFTDYEVKVFVEPQDAYLYRYWCGRERIVVLPENDRGVMFAYNHIRQYARGSGYKYLLHLDDDVDGLIRADNDDLHESLRMTVNDILRQFEGDPILGGVRFTQYRFWVYSKNALKRFTHLNPLLQGNCIVRLGAVPTIDTRMSEFTDTVMTMYLWAAKYYTLNYGLAGLKVVQNANPGGCQMRDRKADGELTIELMKQTFPKVKEKGSGSWFGIDIDVSEYLLPRYQVLQADHKLNQQKN